MRNRGSKGIKRGRRIKIGKKRENGQGKEGAFKEEEEKKRGKYPSRR